MTQSSANLILFHLAADQELLPREDLQQLLDQATEADTGLDDAAAFQEHCAVVEHDDDFTYDCEQARARPRAIPTDRPTRTPLVWTDTEPWTVPPPPPYRATTTLVPCDHTLTVPPPSDLDRDLPLS